MESWIEKENWRYWIDEARKEAEKSTCLRMNFGAIIVKEGKELGRGSNRQPYKKCESCMREEKKIAPRTMAEYCHAFHAEQYAIIDALKKRNNIENAVLVVAGLNPKKREIAYERYTCTLCARMMAVAGLEGVVAPTPAEPKFRKMKEAYDEAYAVQEEIMKSGIKTEEELQNLLTKE